MTTTWPEKRAFTVSVVGLVFQAALSVILLLMWLWNGSEAARAVTLLSACGVPIWVFLALIYKQKQSVREEAFESEQLRQERAAVGTAAALFTGEEELLLARRRLDKMFRWLLPVFTVLTIGLLVYLALRPWGRSLGFRVYDKTWPVPSHASLSLAFAVGAAFLMFLFSRYAIGMARQPEWKLLRAGAAWLTGNSLACIALAAVLGLVQYDVLVPERVLAQVLRILMLVLAAEFLLNFVLDFYRPRQAGDEPRPAFDSRLLGLFCEPGGIARSIAEALNYQFGFEVSSTWFYKLMQRAATPVIFFGVATLFSVSCLVIVDAGDAVIIERFGKPRQTGQVTVRVVDGREVREMDALGPGLHFKLPWPIDKAYRYPADRLLEMVVGTVEEGKAKEESLEKPLLWTEKHEWVPHLNVLVATEADRHARPADAAAATTSPATQPLRTGRSVPVSMLRLSVPVHYRVEDLRAWRENYDDPEKVFNDLGYRVVTKYSANVDVDQVMGADRLKMAEELRNLLQVEADRLKLGVRIVALGMQSVHPPSEVAKDFESVISAESQKRATIRAAESERVRILAEMCGDVVQAERLAEAISQLDRPGASAEQRAQAQALVAELFHGNPEKGIEPITGKAAETVSRAYAEMWQKINEARADADMLELELPIYRTAPRIYRARQYLDVLAEGLKTPRKYLIAADAEPTFQFDLTDPRIGGLEDQLRGEKK